MKISISCETESEDKVPLTLDDERLENNNSLTMIIGEGEKSEAFVLDLADLDAAVTAFSYKQMERLKREKMMD